MNIHSLMVIYQQIVEPRMDAGFIGPSNPTPGTEAVASITPEQVISFGERLIIETPTGHRTSDWISENWKQEFASQGLVKAMGFRSIPYFGWVSLTLDAWTFAQYLEYD